MSRFGQRWQGGITAAEGSVEQERIQSKQTVDSAWLPDSDESSGPPCRFCGTVLEHTFVDLGMSPLCESFVPAGQLNQAEVFYPLRVFVCDRCFLVQLLEYVKPQEIFSEYAYCSSYSDSWLEHARSYPEMISARLGLCSSSRVVEVASNDGYLLQYFVARGIPVLGIEPAANVAAAAVKKGVPSIVKCFGERTAKELLAEGKPADLLIAHNVFAHVPDLNDFVRGLKLLLSPDGVITLEFPHRLRLMEGNQFDTIYHEHFSYFSFLAAQRVLAAHRLKVFDVEELPTHSGSLRLFVCHAECGRHAVNPAVEALHRRENAEGFSGLEKYRDFAEQVKATKRNLVEFLIQAKRGGKSVAGYGALGKGNTLLNYCGIRTDFLDDTVDRNPYKHGKFLPGTHIPVFHPDRLRETRPDFVLILPWNLRHEILKPLADVRERGGQFVIPIPELEVTA